MKMKYSQNNLQKIMQLPDSDEKLGKLLELGLCLGHFNKQPIIDECNRLYNLGYKSPAQRYIERKQEKQ